MAAEPDEVIVLDLPPDIRQRTRTLASGKTQTRFTVEVRGEPVVHHFSNKELGRKPAEQLAEILREHLRQWGASHPVSASTQKKRRYAEKAYSEGKSWALKRYSGGRMGGRRPRPESNDWFSDSGRLAESLYPTWNATDGTWTINTAANRLDRMSFGRGFEYFLSQFSLALNTGAAASDQRFTKAQGEAMSDAIQRKKNIVGSKRAELMQQVASLLRLGR